MDDVGGERRARGRCYESLAHRDWDGLWRDTHPDFVLKTQLQGSYRGPGESRDFIQGQIAAFTSSTQAPDEFIASGDQAVSQENIELVRKAFAGNRAETAMAYWHPQIEYAEDPRLPGAGQASASGIPFEHPWGYVVEVREERIAYLRAYYEPRAALKAAGLSE